MPGEQALGPIPSPDEMRQGLGDLEQELNAVPGYVEQFRKTFRTPSLRNIAETGPYMHDGSKQTLSAVVEFYYRGVPSTTVNGRPLDVQPLLGLSLGAQNGFFRDFGELVR